MYMCVFVYLHCTVMLIFLVVLLTLLLAEHLYIPVSTLIAPITISSTLTLVTLPTPVGIFTGLPDTSLLLLRLLPSLFCHTTVGTGYPVAVHVIDPLLPSVYIKLLSCHWCSNVWSNCHKNCNFTNEAKVFKAHH